MSDTGPDEWRLSPPRSPEDEAEFDRQFDAVMPVAMKVAFARTWYEAGQCPGCFAPLEGVAGKGDGHNRDGGLFYGGGGRSRHGRCEWTADDLTSLVLIGSGTVGYHRGRGDGSPRETAPTRCSSDLPLPGGSQHEP